MRLALKNTKDKLGSEDIINLCQQRYVFIFEGVDELVDKVRVNELFYQDDWSESLFVATVRSGFYADINETANHLYPLKSSRKGIVSASGCVLHFLPFEKSHQNNYVDLYAERYGSEVGLSKLEFKKALDSVPEFSDLMTEPLLMYVNPPLPNT